MISIQDIEKKGEAKKGKKNPSTKKGLSNMFSNYKKASAENTDKVKEEPQNLGVVSGIAAKSEKPKVDVTSLKAEEKEFAQSKTEVTLVEPNTANNIGKREVASEVNTSIEEKAKTKKTKERKPIKVTSKNVDKKVTERELANKDETLDFQNLSCLIGLMGDFALDERRVLTEIMKATENGKYKNVKITRVDFEKNGKINSTKLTNAKIVLSDLNLIKIEPPNWKEKSNNKANLFTLSKKGLIEN